MSTLNEIYKYIEENLSQSRYKHTLGVVEVAKKLAKINDVNEEKAELAALVHDVAKNMSIEKQKSILKNNNINLTEIEEKTPQILHGFVGAIIAKIDLHITDNEVLSAISCHTIAKKNMTTLEKIIYISDYIEPNRKYPGVDSLRKITFENLNKGVLKGLDNTIIFVIEQGELVHPTTLEARNQLLLELKNN